MGIKVLPRKKVEVFYTHSNTEPVRSYLILYWIFVPNGHREKRKKETSQGSLSLTHIYRSP